MDALPKRKMLRLADYDYAVCTAYSVTICVKNRRQVLGDIVTADRDHDMPVMQLSEYGRVVAEGIVGISERHPEVKVCTSVIMPDHIHLLILLANENLGQESGVALPQLVQGFKTFVTKRCGESLFQRSYYDHIIRNEKDFEETWHYIEGNPLRWAEKYDGGHR